MDNEALLQANQTLSKSLTKAKEEIERLWRFKEMYKDQLKHNKDLWRQLNIKRSVYRVIQTKDKVDYLLQVIDVNDTEEGLIITVS